MLLPRGTPLLMAFRKQPLPEADALCTILLKALSATHAPFRDLFWRLQPRRAQPVTDVQGCFSLPGPL